MAPVVSILDERCKPVHLSGAARIHLTEGCSNVIKSSLAIVS